MMHDNVNGRMEESSTINKERGEDTGSIPVVLSAKYYANGR
jgi:hypothetical protein